MFPAVVLMAVVLMALVLMADVLKVSAVASPLVAIHFTVSTGSR